MRKNDGDQFGLTNKIKSGIVISIIIITFQLILIFVQFFLVVKKTDENNTSYPRIISYSPAYTPTTQVNNYVHTQTNSYTNRRIEVIQVRCQSTISIRKVVPKEVYSNLKNCVNAGKILYLCIYKFFDQQKFDGLTNSESI